MKKLFAICLCCLTAQAAAVVRTSISSLPQITTPSTNTYFEVADMSATPKSRKLAISDLKSSVLSGVVVSNITVTNITVQNSLTVSNITVTNVTVQNNLTVSNHFVVNGKNNTLYVTNSITIQTNGELVLNFLPRPSVLVLGTNGNVTNATLSSLTLGNDNTLTATGGGGGLTTDVTTLAWSGTNITGFDCSTNGESFFLLVTNHCLFGASTFSNLPAKTAYKTFTLCLQMDGTGGYVPKFTNSIVAWTDGTQGGQPVIKTNANAVSYVYFHTHLATNSMLVGSPNINVQ